MRTQSQRPVEDRAAVKALNWWDEPGAQPCGGPGGGGHSVFTGEVEARAMLSQQCHPANEADCCMVRPQRARNACLHAPEGGAWGSGLQRVVLWTGGDRRVRAGWFIERPGGGGHSVLPMRWRPVRCCRSNAIQQMRLIVAW